MRSIWSGSLSFGLINIPIRLYSATEDHAISFNMLHKKDLSPIRLARICKEEEKEIPYKDIVKGYEYQKGEYVVISDEEFEQASIEKTGLVEILAFVDESEIDSVYFEKPYYLEPDKNAGKPYALLRETLRKSKKVGLVKFVLKNREHLGVIKPYKDAIVLNQLRFASEIREMEGLKLPSSEEVEKKEVEMALKLVDQLTGTFKPEDYHDTYTAELKEIIEKKVKGIPLRHKGKAPKPSKVHDIMSLLQESLEESSSKKTIKVRRKAVNK